MKELCFVALSLSLLNACAGRPCPARAFRDPAEVLGHHRDLRGPAHVLRAEARVDQRNRDGRIRGTVLMFIERPNHVRFDVMTQVGAAAILTSDGERFALTDLRDNRYLIGQACPANIERLLGLRFSGEEVSRLLFGETPQIEATDREMSCQNGTYRVTLRAEDGRRQELDLEVRDEDLSAAPDDQRVRLRRSEIFTADGTTEWRVTFDDYRVVDDPEEDGERGVAMPFTVRFEDPRRGIDTLMRFERVDLNVAPPSDAFVQQPREGLTVEEVSCE
jgi:hypothetical protein